MPGFPCTHQNGTEPQPQTTAPTTNGFLCCHPDRQLHPPRSTFQMLRRIGTPDSRPAILPNHLPDHRDFRSVVPSHNPHQLPGIPRGPRPTPRIIPPVVRTMLSPKVSHNSPLALTPLRPFLIQHPHNPFTSRMHVTFSPLGHIKYNPMTETPLTALQVRLRDSPATSTSSGPIWDRAVQAGRYRTSPALQASPHSAAGSRQNLYKYYERIQLFWYLQRY